MTPIDPAKTAHYAVSNDLHEELDNLFKAMSLVADLAEGDDGQARLALESYFYMPVFRSFANHGARLMADMPYVSGKPK